MMISALVAPEVDLRDFTFMPLDVIRLRDSDLAAVSTGDGFRAAVLLWCAAWHQVPAASLPSDDRMLARLAGYGRDVSGWQSVRDEALRGFLECEDGRLYHSTIAEKANEAWQAKLKRRARVQAAIDARNQRNLGRDDNRNVERDVDESNERDDERNVHQGTGTGTVDRDIKKTPSLVAKPTPECKKGEGGKSELFDRFWNGFPDHGGMSEPKAAAEFMRLDPADQQAAVDSLPAFADAVRKKPTTHPLAAWKYLAERRFDGFAASAGNVAAKFRHHRDSPQGRAHEAEYRARTGKSPPWVDDHWYFPTEWPPGAEKALGAG